MPVDRCVCHDVSFERLARHAREHGAGLAALQREFGCGTGCGLCIPYVLAMLRTGRTSFRCLPAPDAGDDAADPADDGPRSPPAAEHGPRP